MHRHPKPVRKCHGCGLNFRDHCGIYDCPRAMWERGRCPGYQNAELLAHYERQQTSQAPDKRERRRVTQRLRAAEPHYQGHRDPAHRPPHERPAGPLVR